MSDPYTSPARTGEYATDTVVVTDAGMISTAWDMSDVQVKCDVIQLDNNLNDEYVNYLLTGKSLALILIHTSVSFKL